MEENDRQFLDWADIVSQISYAHENQYPPELYIDEDGVRHATFYKLTFLSTGEAAYKVSRYRFDPKIFWKIEMMVNLYNDDSKLKILYGND